MRLTEAKAIEVYDAREYHPGPHNHIRSHEDLPPVLRDSWNCTYTEELPTGLYLIVPVDGPESLDALTAEVERLRLDAQDRMRDL